VAEDPPQPLRADPGAQAALIRGEDRAEALGLWSAGAGSRGRWMVEECAQLAPQDIVQVLLASP
jgi:hypothetical protein